MGQMNLLQAVNSALDVAMASDNQVLVFGEDVGKFGGVFRATAELQQKYGKERCFDTPLTEQGIVGFANGLAAQGKRPVAEIQFADYIYPAFDQLANESAKFRYRSGAEFDVGGLTVRTPYGGGIGGGHYHSQSPEAFFTHLPGLKVVIPRDPYQAKGLLLASIRDDNPVVFFEPKRLYRASVTDVPEDDYQLPLSQAELIAQGDDLTLVGWGAQVEVILAAAEEARQHDIHCDVIDLRTLQPWDSSLIVESVKRTGRLIISHEAPLTSGFGAEIAATIQEQCFLYLESPITRVCGLDTPFPYSLEHEYLPDKGRVYAAIHASMSF